MTALDDIATERRRQIEAEGWTAKHDDSHIEAEMALAAACYAVNTYNGTSVPERIQEMWPWDLNWWKPTDRRRDLVKAGALIVAEIERLDRATTATPEGE